MTAGPKSIYQLVVVSANYWLSGKNENGVCSRFELQRSRIRAVLKYYAYKMLCIVILILCDS